MDPGKGVHILYYTSILKQFGQFNAPNFEGKQDLQGDVKSNYKEMRNFIIHPNTKNL